MSTSLSNVSKRVAVESVAQTVGDTAVETTIFSKPVPGKTLGSDGALRFTAILTLQNATGGAISVTFKEKMDAVGPASLTSSIPAGTITIFHVIFLIGASGSGSVSHQFFGVILPRTSTNMNATVASGTFDNTVDQTFSVTALWASAPGVSPSITMHYGMLEIVGNP